MILKAIREGLGRLIVLVDYLTRPKPITRTETDQQAIDEAAKDLALYQFYACPFCVRTRRVLHRLNLPVEIRDAQHDQQHRRELEEQGGKLQVPCLRVERDGQTTWMYESAAIIEYLTQRFDPEAVTEKPAA